MNLFIALISAILASGVISAIVTFQLGASLQERNLLLGKLEALHRAFHDFTAGLTAYAIPFAHAMKGQITSDQALEIATAEMKDAGIHYRDMRMLVTLYFPRLHEPFRHLLECRDRLNDSIATFRKSYEAGAQDEPTSREAFRKEFLRLDELEKEVTDAMVREARLVRSQYGLSFKFLRHGIFRRPDA